MTKLAAKRPEALRTVVSVSPNVAEAWYAKPVHLGLLEFRGNYWFTTDGSRHVSSRDALAYLIQLYELATRPEPRAAPARAPAPPAARPAAPKGPSGPARVVRSSEGAEGPQVRDPFVKDLLTYLRAHPEVKELLKS